MITIMKEAEKSKKKTNRTSTKTDRERDGSSLNETAIWHMAVNTQTYILWLEFVLSYFFLFFTAFHAEYTKPNPQKDLPLYTDGLISIFGENTANYNNCQPLTGAAPS